MSLTVVLSLAGKGVGRAATVRFGQRHDRLRARGAGALGPAVQQIGGARA